MTDALLLACLLAMPAVGVIAGIVLALRHRLTPAHWRMIGIAGEVLTIGAVFALSIAALVVLG